MIILPRQSGESIEVGDNVRFLAKVYDRALMGATDDSGSYASVDAGDGGKVVDWNTFHFDGKSANIRLFTVQVGWLFVVVNEQLLEHV